jgi:sorbitol-specific phosphotransferase system component IIBC
VSVPVAVGVMVTEQVAEAVVPARVHVPPGVNVTVPVGVDVVPVAVSVTVAVHDVACPTNTVDGVHATVVVVVRRLTVTLVLPELVACVESPP